MAIEKHAIKYLPKQFEASFEKAKVNYCKLFNDPSLDFDQSDLWHKWEDGTLVQASDDEEELLMKMWFLMLLETNPQLLENQGMPLVAL